jgi:UDP-N-acetylmuramoyl-tripeptide--D-alanyl-D-alanine ligase
MLSLREAAALLGGEATLVGDAGVRFERVHSDTRTLQPGDLFVALRGERFDAHDFLAQARAAGAAAAIAERGLAEAGLPGLLVPDALAALQRLAAAWRRRFHLPLIAVAGSNGKTTVTQMVASILRAAHGDAAFATQGNLNNHIGAPLTLLRLREGHRAGVVELGMNHPGEIALLAGIAAPTVALVNNAQREHQEFMATVEASARENGAAIEALPADGTAVFPADDAFAPLWRGLAGARRCLTFARSAVAAEVTARADWSGAHWALALRTPAGTVDALLRMPGAHNLHNALAATAGALAAGAPLAAVVAGLAAFEPVAGRNRLHRLRLGGRSVTLVDDSYNANPDSVRAAIDLLAALPGPHWLVLGDMGEVGAQGPAFHAEVGAHARTRGIAHFWAAGPACADAAAAYGDAARHFPDVDALLAALPQAPAAASALVKGSRFMRMERVVRALLLLAEAEGA